LSSEKKIKILKEILGGFFTVGGERLFKCPACKHHKKKMSVNIEKDSFKCWICDYKSPTIYRLVRRFGNYEHRRQWEELTGRMDHSADREDLAEIIRNLGKKAEEVPEEFIELPKEFKTLTSKNKPLTAFRPIKYLKSRGLSENDIVKWKIGYCGSGEYEGRIIVPSFNENGDLNYFIARKYTDSFGPNYANPSTSKDLVFNELCLNWKDDLVLVEGVFDAIVAENSIPLLGSSIREDSKLFLKIASNNTPLYVALDPDAESKAIKLIEKLLKYDLEVYKIDVSGYDDVGSMPREIFKQRKEEAIPMDTSLTCIEQALKNLSAI
jgi:DNA primase